MPCPDLSRMPEYYHKYINQVKEDDLVIALRNNTSSFLFMLEMIPTEKLDYRYAEGKWTIKEVLQHIIDTERVFTYRALRFARKDNTPLPGFDQDIFAANAKADKRKWNELVDEFTSLRRATELMFGSFDDAQLESAGTATNVSMYVLGVGYIIVGHCIHHMNILKEKYLEKENQPA
jgi:hypothetical protein